MKFTPAKDWQSSWLQGDMNTTYAKLVEVFGPEHSKGDDYKVQAEWNLIFEDGTYATIYDYKEGDAYNGPGQGIPKEQVTDWHIGGTNPAAADRVKDALLEYTTAEIKDEVLAAPVLLIGDQVSGVAKPTIDEIAKMAEQACFYVDSAGLWLRMDYCDMDEGTFQCHNEESGEEYNINFSEITLEGDECFHELTKMAIPTE